MNLFSDLANSNLGAERNNNFGRNAAKAAAGEGIEEEEESAENNNIKG
jgi:hypothetical protein